MPPKVSLSGISTLSRTPFSPPLQSYTFSNDGSAAVTIAIDDALVAIPAGEGLKSSVGEVLGAFAVVANASSSAWRFIGSYD